ILNVFPGETGSDAARANQEHPHPVSPNAGDTRVGQSGVSSTRVYEDAGNTLGYKTNEFAWTEVRQSRQAQQLKIEIMPVSGSYPGMLAERAYEIRLPVSWPPQSVTCNSQALSFSREGAVPGWHYDGDKLTTIISLPKQSLTRKVEVTVSFPEAVDGRRSTVDLEGAAGKIARIKRAMAMTEMSWPNGWAPDVMLEAAQTGNRIGLHPETAAQELERLQRNLSEIKARLEALARELLTIKDNGEGYGMTPQQQLTVVRQAIAHVAAP
ncbi:MAG: DUF5110 domain-containing protein, partial [Terriglobales bacterium]